jgi:hypothetical protein
MFYVILNVGIFFLIYLHLTPTHLPYMMQEGCDCQLNKVQVPYVNILNCQTCFVTCNEQFILLKFLFLDWSMVESKYVK